MAKGICYIESPFGVFIAIGKFSLLAKGGQLVGMVITDDAEGILAFTPTQAHSFIMRHYATLPVDSVNACLRAASEFTWPPTTKSEAEPITGSVLKAMIFMATQNNLQHLASTSGTGTTTQDVAYIGTPPPPGTKN